MARMDDTRRLVRNYVVSLTNQFPLRGCEEISNGGIVATFVNDDVEPNIAVTVTVEFGTPQ